MFCTNCGNKLNTGDSFCTECGTKVGTIEKNINTDKTVLLKVTRERRTFGVAIPFPLYIDGEKIGTLKNGMSLEKEVTQDKHLVEFVCADGNVKQEIDLTNEPGVEITIRARMGFIAASVYITKIEYK